MTGRSANNVRVSIEISATPERVWEVVEPIENHVDWMSDAESIRFHGEQRRGVGTTFVCRTKVGPLVLDDEMQITEWEPGRVMGVRHQGLVTGTGRFVLVPIDGGRRTRFEWEERLTFPRWLGGRAGALLAGRAVFPLIWRRNLARLAKIAEARPTGPGLAGGTPPGT